MAGAPAIGRPHMSRGLEGDACTNAMAEKGKWYVQGARQTVRHCHHQARHFAVCGLVQASSSSRELDRTKVDFRRHGIAPRTIELCISARMRKTEYATAHVAALGTKWDPAVERSGHELSTRLVECADDITHFRTITGILRLWPEAMTAAFSIGLAECGPLTADQARAGSRPSRRAQHSSPERTSTCSLAGARSDRDAARTSARSRRLGSAR